MTVQDSQRGPQSGPEAPSPASEALEQLLAAARKRGASDLHIGANLPPLVRLHGQVFVLQRDKLAPDQAKAVIFSALTRTQREVAENERGVEALLNKRDGRYRMCVIKQRLGWDACFHIIPQKIATADELGIPKEVQQLTSFRNGLILVTGPRGSGKTTTLAALLNVVNHSRADHILTLEDPVEYLIPSVRCIVSQRTVGLHTETFASALRAALREDPDVIAVGELRDSETISMAITAAETGHLVIASLHTGSAIGAVARVVDAFTLDQQPQVRAMISESLRGVVSQRLVPRADGSGRVLAAEVLINTPGVGSLIRENRLHQVRSVIQTSKRQGMRLLDEDLARIVKEGLVLPDVARELAESPERFGGKRAQG